MDKKQKKRMEVLHQPDDPAEAPRLEKELAAAHEELSRLKQA